MARTPRVLFSSETPTDFDHSRFAEAIANRLAVAATHRAEVEPRVLPESGRKRVDADAAFVDEEEAQRMFDWLLIRLGRTGGPTGSVSYHLCSHALGEESTEPCTAAPGFTNSTG